MGTDINGHAEGQYGSSPGTWYKIAELPNVRSYEVFSLFTDYRERDHIRHYLYDIDDDGRAVMKGLPEGADVTADEVERWNCGITWYDLSEVCDRSLLWQQIMDDDVRKMWLCYLDYLKAYARVHGSAYKVRLVMGFDN